MRVTMCEREQDVVRALRTGFWPEGLRAHAGSCDSCGEAMLVAAALLEADAVQPAQVPDAGLIWWKTELRLKREKAEKAMRPVMIAELATAAATGVALLVGGAWLWSTSQASAITIVACLSVLAISAGSAIAVAVARK